MKLVMKTEYGDVLQSVSENPGYDTLAKHVLITLQAQAFAKELGEKMTMWHVEAVIEDIDNELIVFEVEE